MSENFLVEIISPDNLIIESEATEVTIPSYEGQMGILKDHIPLITFLRPGLIVIKKNDTEIVLPVKDSKIFNDLSKLAKDAFKALGGKSLGRIDIKMNHLGVPHFIEANLMPGLQKGYFYRSCVLNLNMNYDDMILSITNTGLTSH